MPSLTVRSYEPDDATVVRDLHERALRDAGAFDPELRHLDADLGRIEAAYLDAGGAFLVGEYDGSIVAMGAVRPLAADPLDVPTPIDHADYVDDPSRAGALRRMRVDPDHFRRGFGSRVLSALERAAGDAGLGTLVLDTTSTQTAAVAFYEHHGYERVAERPTDHGRLLVYRRRLDSPDTG